MRAIALILAVATVATAHAGGLYKWTDPASGEIVYSNEPPPAAIKKVEEKKLVPSSIQTSILPYSVQQAVQRSPITLYASNCGEFCDGARAYLSKRGLPYVEKNPQVPADAEQYHKASNGGTEVPLLVVGMQVIRGFDAAQYDAVLESAGYPKTPLTALGVKPVQAKASPPSNPDAKSSVSPSVQYIGPLALTRGAAPLKLIAR